MLYKYKIILLKLSRSWLNFYFYRHNPSYVYYWV